MLPGFYATMLEYYFALEHYFTFVSTSQLLIWQWVVFVTVITSEGREFQLWVVLGPGLGSPGTDGEAGPWSFVLRACNRAGRSDDVTTACWPKISGKAFLLPVLPELRNSWMGGSVWAEGPLDGPAPWDPASITANIFNSDINSSPTARIN